MKCRTKFLLSALLLTFSVPFFLTYRIQLQTERETVSRMDKDTPPRESPRHDGLGGRRTLEETKKPVSLTTPTNPTSQDRSRSETTRTVVPSPSERPSPSEGAPNQVPVGAEELRKTVESLNSKEVVLNADKFDSLQNDDVVFIVQVHRRLHYLQYLIESLRKVADIDRVLLIFSHDYMDGDINKLIQSIDFCKVCMYICSVCCAKVLDVSVALMYVHVCIMCSLYGYWSGSMQFHYACVENNAFRV